jgi:hypothetical protein
LAVAAVLLAVLYADEDGSLMSDSLMALVMGGFCLLPGLVAGLAASPRLGGSILRVAFLSAIGPVCLGLAGVLWLLLALTASGFDLSAPSGALILFVGFSIPVVVGNLIGALAGAWIVRGWNRPDDRDYSAE